MTPEEWKRRGQEAAEQARQMQRRSQMHESASCLPLTPPPLTRRPAPPEPPCDTAPAKPEPPAPPALPMDSDRALLLVLIVLLMKNDAPLELILALCYLAM